jgi:hypothetical protein
MAAWGADNSIGTWKVNIEKSKYAPGPIPVKTRTSGREVVPRGVKATNSGERTRPEAWWAVLMRQTLRCRASGGAKLRCHRPEYVALVESAGARHYRLLEVGLFVLTTPLFYAVSVTSVNRER